LEKETVNRSNSTPAILAAMAAVTGCVPMEPVEPVVQVSDDDEICRMESSMGSHVKEEICRHKTHGSISGDPESDREIDEVFGDMVFERIPDPPAAEGKCGSQ